MTTQIEYALLAANSYAVKPSVTSDANTIPIPKNWVKLDDRIDDPTGFTANQRGQHELTRNKRTLQ